MVTLKMYRFRRAAARRQKLRCYYCDAHMWLTDPAKFLVQFGVALEQATRFQCTAEHLVARSAGGPNTQANVVVACRHCNYQRHESEDKDALDHLHYREFVREQMRAGAWHPEWAVAAGIVGATAPTTC